MRLNSRIGCDARMTSFSILNPASLIRRYSIRKLLLSFSLALLVELVVFNFAFWESLTFSNAQNLSYYCGAGMLDHGDGKIEIVDSDNAYIEIDANGAHVDNIYLLLGKEGWASSSWRDALGPFITCRIAATDASSSAYITMPEITYCGALQDSHYVRLHLSGGSDSMRVYFSGEVGDLLNIQDVRINVVRPFNFIISRFLIVWILLLFFQLFRPASPIYSHGFDNHSRLARVAIVCTVAFQVALIIVISRLSGVVDSPSNSSTSSIVSGNEILDFNQYNHLANSLIDGHFNLDLQVSPILETMDNPYDSQERVAAFSGTDQYYYMDYAYYEGEYYSYFGVLPAVTMYVPYKLITGMDLRTDRVVTILSAAYVVSINILIICSLRRFVPKASLGSFCLSSISIFSCSGLLYLAFLPQLYSVPILMGLCCVFLGVSSWLFASISRGNMLRKRWLAIGGLLIALSLACRPQYVLTACLAFPIFWDSITERREFFSRKGIANTAAVMVPFILVAIPVMYYNVSRFGSPFDFGAAYNLTGSDMTSRGVVLARTVPALFQYLFQPPAVSASYPYLHAVDMNVDYQGYWFYEPYLGGFFSFAPIVFILFLLPGRLKEYQSLLGRFIVFCCILALIILFADLQIASITTRYFNDFSWLLLIPAWMMIGADLDFLRKHPSVFAVVIVAAFVGVSLNMVALLSPDRYGALIQTCPSVYYSLSSWVRVL